MLVTATDGTINMYTAKLQDRQLKLEFISKVRQHADLIRIVMIVEDRQVLSAGYDRKIGAQMQPHTPHRALAKRLRNG